MFRKKEERTKLIEKRVINSKFFYSEKKKTRRKFIEANYSW